MRDWHGSELEVLIREGPVVDALRVELVALLGDARQVQGVVTQIHEVEVRCLHWRHGLLYGQDLQPRRHRRSASRRFVPQVWHLVRSLGRLLSGHRQLAVHEPSRDQGSRPPRIRGADAVGAAVRLLPRATRALSPLRSLRTVVALNHLIHEPLMPLRCAALLLASHLVRPALPELLEVGRGCGSLLRLSDRLGLDAHVPRHHDAELGAGVVVGAAVRVCRVLEVLLRRVQLQLLLVLALEKSQFGHLERGEVVLRWGGRGGSRQVVGALVARETVLLARRELVQERAVLLEEVLGVRLGHWIDDSPADLFDVCYADSEVLRRSRVRLRPLRWSIAAKLVHAAQAYTPDRVSLAMSLRLLSFGLQVISRVLVRCHEILLCLLLDVQRMTPRGLAVLDAPLGQLRDPCLMAAVLQRGGLARLSARLVLRCDLRRRVILVLRGAVFSIGLLSLEGHRRARVRAPDQWLSLVRVRVRYLSVVVRYSVESWIHC